MKMRFENDTKPPTRFHILMAPDLAQEVQDLVDETGLSRGEIFRRAIALYKVSKRCQIDGGNVLFRESDGTLKEVVNF